VHNGAREFGDHLAQRRQGEGSEWDGERYRDLVPVEHPVVRVHWATAHHANRDYGGARRVMHRVTMRGDVPVGVAAREGRSRVAARGARHHG
jgi:taurine dioxygenase